MALDGEEVIWTNWVGNQQCHPTRIEQAGTEAEIAAAVARALDEGLGIRTAGSGHSFTPIVETPGVLLDTRGLSGVVSVDAEGEQVTALAHTTIAQLGEPLWNAGLALRNQGDIDSQALAGAVATSTHGSGRHLGSYSAELTACRLVDGQGQLRSFSLADDPEVFPAFQCSVGLLGIMTELTLSVTKAYHLHEEILFLHADAVRERWADLQRDYRHFSFFWMPTDSSSGLYGFPEAKADHCMVKLYRECPAPTGAESLPAGQRIDRSYRIYPHVFEPNFHELEYFLPASAGLEAFDEQRRFMLANLPDAVYPLEVRFVAADEAWMSPNYQRDSLVLSVSGKPGTDYWPYLKACDERMAAAGGRPHWGKLHFMTAERLAERFPRYGDFSAVRQDLDPKGAFLNPHLAAMFS
ncbi:MAG: D-arabinono-1,4-lactone oxidase [Pseudomonadota bacterium]